MATAEERYSPKYTNPKYSPVRVHQPAILSENDVVKLTGVKLSSLRTLAKTWPDGACWGPKPLHIGRKTAYSRDTVMSWMERQTDPAAAEDLVDDTSTEANTETQESA